MFRKTKDQYMSLISLGNHQMPSRTQPPDDLPSETSARLPTKKSTGRQRRTVVTLVSCCLCLGVAFVCSTVALVFVARHYVYNAMKDAEVAKGVAREADVGSIRAKRLVTRLPQDTRPVRYDLTLRPDLETGSYTGMVTIHLRIHTVHPRNYLQLHSSNLTINTVDLQRLSDNRTIRVQNVVEGTEEEIIKVVTKEKLISGEYRLSVGFAGSLSGKLRGFYKSRYTAGDGRER